METSKEAYSKEEIKKYLDDWDNLQNNGWFNNPNKDIAHYTFHNKNFSNLSEFLTKGREIIKQGIDNNKIIRVETE